MNTDLKFTVMFHEFVQSSIGAIIQQCGVPKVSVEIGLFEGHTTFNMTSMIVQHNPDYKHYAIDPFSTSADLPNDVVSEAAKLFRHNLDVFEHNENIEFINKTSGEGLIELINRDVEADFIYIDGDHRASTVLEDLVLSFQILRQGGAILCDDVNGWKYTDQQTRQSPLQQSPKLAVDNFIQCFWDRIEIITLPNGYQTAFKKIC